MSILAYILTTLVALEHFYIMYLEMFALNSPKARQIFNLDEQTAINPKIQLLFANQGLYNGFLASGLIFFPLYSTKCGHLFLFNLCDCCCGLWGDKCEE